MRSIHDDLLDPQTSSLGKRQVRSFGDDKYTPTFDGLPKPRKSDNAKNSTNATSSANDMKSILKLDAAKNQSFKPDPANMSQPADKKDGDENEDA